MGNEIKTQIGAIAKNSRVETNTFCLEDDVYPAHPGSDSREDSFGEEVAQIGDHNPSNDVRIATFITRTPLS